MQLIGALLCAALVLVTNSSSVRTLVPVSSTSVPTFQSLTVQQRAQLPDSTKVLLGKYVTTLGQLRAEHRSRTLHISNASTAGTAALQTVNASKGTHLSLSAANYTHIALDAGGTIAEPAKDYSQNALDAQKFCNAAQAAICLYYPASTTLTQSGGWSENIDPYITDASVCASQGGLMLSWACQYNYNDWYHLQFNPGSGFTYKAACDSTYWTISNVDKHGSIQVDSVITLGTTFTTGGGPSSCVVRVWVTP